MREGEIFGEWSQKKESSLWKLKASVDRSSLSVRTAGRSSSWWGIHPQAWERTGFADSMEFMHQQDHRIHIFLCKIPVPVKSVNLYKTYVQQNTSKTGISTFRRPWPWTAGDQEQEFGHLRKAAGHCATMRILRGHGGICFTRGLNHWVILSRTDTTSRVGCTSYCKATFPLPKFHEFWLWSNLPSKFLFEVS